RSGADGVAIHGGIRGRPAARGALVAAARAPGCRSGGSAVAGRARMRATGAWTAEPSSSGPAAAGGTAATAGRSRNRAGGAVRRDPPGGTAQRRPSASHPDEGRSAPAAGGSRLTVAAAFATIYIVWGSTYLAIAMAVETLPPFLMTGTRMLLAGGVLYGW